MSYCSIIVLVVMEKVSQTFSVGYQFVLQFAYFFSHQHISQSTVWTSYEKQLLFKGVGSVPVFLRKPLVIFQGRSGSPGIRIWLSGDADTYRG